MMRSRSGSIGGCRAVAVFAAAFAFGWLCVGAPARARRVSHDYARLKQQQRPRTGERFRVRGKDWMSGLMRGVVGDGTIVGRSPGTRGSKPFGAGTIEYRVGKVTTERASVWKLGDLPGGRKLFKVSLEPRARPRAAASLTRFALVELSPKGRAGRVVPIWEENQIRTRARAHEQGKVYVPPRVSRKGSQWHERPGYFRRK